jgi:hypothetical protein
MDKMRLTSYARELQETSSRARASFLGQGCPCGCICVFAGTLDQACYSLGVHDGSINDT